MKGVIDLGVFFNVVMYSFYSKALNKIKWKQNISQHCVSAQFNLQRLSKDIELLILLNRQIGSSCGGKIEFVVWQ